MIEDSRDKLQLLLFDMEQKKKLLKKNQNDPQERRKLIAQKRIQRRKRNQLNPTNYLKYKIVIQQRIPLKVGIRNIKLRDQSEIQRNIDQQINYRMIQSNKLEQIQQFPRQDSSFEYCSNANQIDKSDEIKNKTLSQINSSGITVNIKDKSIKKQQIQRQTQTQRKILQQLSQKFQTLQVSECKNQIQDEKQQLTINISEAIDLQKTSNQIQINKIEEIEDLKQISIEKHQIIATIQKEDGLQNQKGNLQDQFQLLQLDEQQQVQLEEQKSNSDNQNNENSLRNNDIFDD